MWQMKARLYKDAKENTYRILCFDGTIASATIENLKIFLKDFKEIEKLSGTLGNWDDSTSSMIDYEKNQKTYAYITDSNELIIYKFDPFDILLNSTKSSLDDFIGAAEYAEAVGKSVEQIKVLLRAGKIPNARKIGRDWIIEKDSIANYPIGKRGKPSKA